MNPTRITTETLPFLVQQLKMAVDAKKSYQCSITLHDSSLKARQRALAKCWYKTIAEEQGITVGAAEAFCKLHYGLRIRIEDDLALEGIIDRMLHGHDYENKLEIIEMYPEWFPVLRDKGGMTSDQQARYLHDIQVGFANQGVILSSPNDKELLKYPEASL